MKENFEKAVVDLEFLEDVEEIVTPGNQGGFFCCIISSGGGSAFCC